MFRGRSVHTLDAKGRIRIPTRFRDILKARYGDRCIITNLDRCLIAYPLQEWERSTGRTIIGSPGCKGISALLHFWRLRMQF